MAKNYFAGSYVFAGCLMVGIGLGLLFNQVAAGTTIGLGIGLILMGVLNKK